MNPMSIFYRTARGITGTIAVHRTAANGTRIHTRAIPLSVLEHAHLGRQMLSRLRMACVRAGTALTCSPLLTSTSRR